MRIFIVFYSTSDRIFGCFMGCKTSVSIINEYSYTEIISFIEKSFVHYKRLKDKYLLNNLIHIGILAKHTSYKENKILLMANFLEVLRYNFAINVGVPTNLFTHEGSNFKWTSGTKQGHPASFKEILTEFCNSNAITCWDDDFKDIRNEIIHTGALGGVNSLKRYFDLHHFCDPNSFNPAGWKSLPIGYGKMGGMSVNRSRCWYGQLNIRLIKLPRRKWRFGFLNFGGKICRNMRNFVELESPDG